MDHNAERVRKRNGLYPKTRHGKFAPLLLLIATTALASMQLLAAGPIQAWVQRYPNATGTRIALDPYDDVLVTGCIGSYGPGVLIKYSNHGVALWTNTGSFFENVASDRDGNAFVTGYYPNPGRGNGMTVPCDYLTAAYSRSGIPLWTNYFNSATNSNEHAYGIATDTAGNVYVSGVSTLGHVTIAYSPTGAPLWTNTFNSSEYIYYSYSTRPVVKVDHLGRVIVGATGCLNTDAGCAPSYVVAAYSNTGTQLWRQLFDHYGSYGIVQDMALDTEDNVYVTGDRYYGGCMTVAWSNNAARLWFNFPTYNHYYEPGLEHGKAIAAGVNGQIYVAGYGMGTNTGHDFLTIAYSSTGTRMWTNRYDGPSHANDYAQAIAMSPEDIVYVAGYSWGTNNNYDYVILAYSADGVPLWTNRYNGPTNGFDQAYAMAVDAQGNIYLTGYSQGDCTTIKYVFEPAICFSDLKLLSGPACRFTLNAPTNVACRLDASCDLVQWMVLTNFPPLTSGSIEYTDALSQDFRQRFYRAVWTP